MYKDQKAKVTGGLSVREKCNKIAFVVMVLAVIVLGTASCFNAIKWLNKPFPGFLVNARLVVPTTGQHYWTGVQAGLKNPDMILKVDNQIISTTKDLEEIVKKTEVGHPITYSVKKEGKVVEIVVRTMLFDWKALLTSFGIPLLSGLFYLIIGSVVYIMKPDIKSSQAFFLVCFFLSIFTISGFDIISTHHNIILRVYFFAELFFPATFIHLSLVFPEEKSFIERKPYLLLIPYIISTILIIPIEIFYPQDMFLSIYKWTSLYTILCCISLIYFILKAFFKYSSIIARQRARVLLFGASLAFPLPAVVTTLPYMGFTVVAGKIPDSLMAIPIMIFPGSIAYAIVRHNLFDVDVFIRRTVGYVIMTAIVGFFYFAVQTLINTIVVDMFLGESAKKVFPLIFALLVVIFINPLNMRIQGIVDRIFFRQKYYFKEMVAAASSTMTHLLGLEEIAKQFIRSIRTEMAIDSAGIILLEPEKRTCRSFFMEEDKDVMKDHTHHQSKDVRIAYDDPLLTLVTRERKMITRFDIEENPRFRNIRESCIERFVDLEASLAIPLIYQDEIKGIFAIGNKKSGHFYSRNDIELLNTLTNQVTASVENAKIIENMKKDEMVRTNLARYLSPQVVDQIVSKDMDVNLGGDSKVVTILFSDIRDFTTLTETKTPDQLVQILNEYFTEMADTIFENQGSLDKFIGDAIVAVFGSLVPLENPADNAVKASIEMMEKLPALNERWRKEYDFEMHIGIGVNTGKVFLGNLGSPERMEFTVIGDAVNVASRFSGLAKAGQILMTRETQSVVGKDIKYVQLPSSEVKGKTGKLEVFEIPY